MKNIDKRIRNLAKKEKLNADTAFLERQNRMAENLVKQSWEKSGKVQAALLRKYLAAGAAVFVLTALFVKTAAPYVSGHFSGIEIQEQEKNRTQTAVYEEDKQDELFEQETFQDSGQPFQDSKRELQSGQEGNAGNSLVQKNQDSLPEMISEEDAFFKAAFYAETMYGISAENVESSLHEEDGIYEAEFMTDGCGYQISIMADTGAFRSAGMEDDGFVYYQENMELKEGQIKKRAKQAKQTAARLLGSEPVITGGKVQYKVNAQGQVPHGTVLFLFDLENGDRLRMSYSMAEDSVWGAGIEKGGAGVLDRNVKEGETRVFMEIK